LRVVDVHCPSSATVVASQGGVSGAVAKTMTAPIERVKLLIQTQDANPKARVFALVLPGLCTRARC
jgi:hypothetical protein